MGEVRQISKKVLGDDIGGFVGDALTPGSFIKKELGLGGQKQESLIGDPKTTERFAREAQLQDLKALREDAEGQFGGAAFQRGLEAQEQFATTLGQAAQTGLPDQQDISRAQDLAAEFTKARRQGLRDVFQRQEQESNQLAAALGRGQVDPVLRAKLAAEQSRAAQSVFEEQDALAQQFSQQGFQNRLQLGQQRAGILSTLGASERQRDVGQFQRRLGIAGEFGNVVSRESNIRIGKAQIEAARPQDQSGAALGSLLGAGAGFLVGGPAGIGIGSQLGGTAGSLFG
jgi:hypothetical protein